MVARLGKGREGNQNKLNVACVMFQDVQSNCNEAIGEFELVNGKLCGFNDIGSIRVNKEAFKLRLAKIGPQIQL